MSDREGTEVHLKKREPFVTMKLALEGFLDELNKLRASICVTLAWAELEIEKTTESEKTYACPFCGHECGPDDISSCLTLRCPKCGEVFEPEEESE